MARKTFLSVVIIWMAAGLGNGEMFENNISPLSYHTCNYTMTTNVSTLVAFQMPYKLMVPCGGWIPWKRCSKTKYKTEYRSIQVPETSNVTRCCEGYEHVGDYCALSFERFSEFASRRGMCPTIAQERTSHKCASDIDCPWLQKCCNVSSGFFCASCTPRAHDRNTVKHWYNGTITIKMGFDELRRVDPGFLNHTRLLHSMITGELGPLKTLVHHIATESAGAFAVRSYFHIEINESDSLGNILSKLNNIVTRLPEVIDIKIEEMLESPPSATDEPVHGYSPTNHSTPLVAASSIFRNLSISNVTSSGFHIQWNTDGRENHTYNVQVSALKGVHLSNNTNQTHMDICDLGAGELYAVRIQWVDTKGQVHLLEENVKTASSIFRHLSISNVTSSGFHIQWNTDGPENNTYNVQVSALKGVHLSNNTNQTHMEICDLGAGELYAVRIRWVDTKGQVHLLEENVKTEAQILSGTLKITNGNFTKNLLNSSSTEYVEFVRKFIEEVKKSLCKKVAGDTLTVEVQSLSAGSIIVQFLLKIPDSNTPINITASSFSSVNESGSFVIDPKSILIAESSHYIGVRGALDSFYRSTLKVQTKAGEESLCLQTAHGEPVYLHVLNNEEMIKYPLYLYCDFDECSSPSENDCGVNAECKNLEVSYTCQCYKSYVDTNPTRPGRNCEGVIEYRTTPYPTEPDTNIPSSSTKSMALDTGNVHFGTTSVNQTLHSSTIVYTTHLPTETSEPIKQIAALQDPTRLANRTIFNANSSGVFTMSPAPWNTTTIYTSPNTVPEYVTNQSSTGGSNPVSVANTETPNKTQPASSVLASTSVILSAVTITSPDVHTGSFPNLTLPSTPTISISHSTLQSQASTNASLIPHPNPTTETLKPHSNELSTDVTTTLMSSDIHMSLKEASNVLCEVGTIGIAIQRTYLKKRSITESSLYLGAQRCNVSSSNDSHVLLRADWKECGIEVHSTKTQTVVNTTLYIVLTSTVLNGIHPSVKSISSIRCVFQNDILASSGYNPERDLTIYEDIQGDGSFVPDFQMFNGDQPIPKNQTLSARDDIVIKIGIKEGGSQFKVVITECWATPTSNEKDPISFLMINKSCALPNTFTTIINNGVSMAEFKTTIFALVDTAVVYLHCRLNVCKETDPGTCKTSCDSVRSVRSSEKVISRYASYGPLYQASRTTNSITPHPPKESPLGPGYIALIIVVIFAFVAGGAAILVFWHQRRTGIYKFKINFREVGYQVFYG